jgi:uridine kinase
MDDFFLRPEQRTPQRFAEVGGNVDRERFLTEVLLPLHHGESVQYRRFDCSSMQVLPPETVQPGALTVIEGAYSLHPDLAPYYDFSAFLDIQPDLQKARIRKRNASPLAERFFTEWIPLEEIYFRETDIRTRVNLCIPITE